MSFDLSRVFEHTVNKMSLNQEFCYEFKEALEKGTIIQYLLSDAGQISVWPTVKRYLSPGKALYFSHGFGITFMAAQTMKMDAVARITTNYTCGD